MDWDRLKTFYHVATAGSISRAMDTIHLSQSAITRQIQSLEHSLKTKLFKRHTKGITLTEQGSYLFEETEKIFADLNSIEKIIVELYLSINSKIIKKTHYGKFVFSKKTNLNMALSKYGICLKQLQRICKKH